MDIQSKAKNLIEMIQMAPVEWKPLGKVASIGKGKQLNKSLLREKDKYPVINGGINPSGYWHEYNNEAGTIVISQGGASAGFVNWMDIPFFAGAHAYTIKANEDKLLQRFAYYFLKMKQITFMQCQYGAGIPALAKSELQNLLIPIPPLEIQQKIVKILDKFTELEATLEAELALRKRQYQYYRDFLLDFDNQIGGWIADGYQCRLKDVVWKTLGEVGKFTYGYIAKAQDAGTARFIRISDINANGKLIPNGEKYIDVLPECKKYLLKKNDLLMARTGATYGKTMIFSEDYPAVYAGFLIKLDFDKNILIPKYYWHFAQGELFWRQANKLVSGGGQPQLNANALKMIKIPIPPIPEQEKITAILDKFDILTHSISEGLPHEIALRRKQYEYYREQLLAFPKAA